MNEGLRSIPQIETLLQHPEISQWIPRLSRVIVTSIVRRSAETHRGAISGGEIRTTGDLVADILSACRTKEREKLQRVVNATGVIVHTNLGRSPFTAPMLDNLTGTLSGYCNLEYHLPSGKRGKRGGFAEELLSAMVGSEDTLILNNNASSVFLILVAFASGHEAIVSRGELIQIGGGFRIPDIMAQTGARMVEVGTTNITTLEDFRSAITPDTSMIFSAHRSNFAIEGFTEEPTLAELSRLKSESVMLVRDLGSGNLVSGIDLPRPFEPTIAQELKQGADLVCFSGDKLIGGPQAGIITGRRDLIAILRKHPLMRMLRVDKLIYLMLQETLLAHAEGNHEVIGTWDMYRNRIERGVKKRNALRKKCPKAAGWLRSLDLPGTFGGGSLPTLRFPVPGLALTPPSMDAGAVACHFLEQTPPVVGTIVEEEFTLNMMTILDRDIDHLAAIINSLTA